MHEDEHLEMQYEDRHGPEVDLDDYYAWEEQQVDDDDMVGDCEICGERYDQRSHLDSVGSVGEFVAPDGTHLIAHAECGLNAEYVLA